MLVAVAAKAAIRIDAAELPRSQPPSAALPAAAVRASPNWECIRGFEAHELQKQAEKKRLRRDNKLFAFYMDWQKEECEQGVTISCTTK